MVGLWLWLQDCDMIWFGINWNPISFLLVVIKFALKLSASHPCQMRTKLVDLIDRECYCQLTNDVNLWNTVRVTYCIYRELSAP